LALVILAGILVLLDVGGLWSRMVRRMGIPGRAVKLAFLPFANLTGDAEQDSLSDGFAQEMIVQLGRLHPQTLSVPETEPTICRARSSYSRCVLTCAGVC
jgi:hypothetical protein